MNNSNILVYLISLDESPSCYSTVHHKAVHP